MRPPFAAASRNSRAGRRFRRLLPGLVLLLAAGLLALAPLALHLAAQEIETEAEAAADAEDAEGDVEDATAGDADEAAEETEAEIVELPDMPVQEMLARADSQLDIPGGLFTGELSLVYQDGRASRWDFTLYRRATREEEHLLWQFSSRRRGLEAKLLFLNNGEEVWYYDVLRAQLARKRDFEKYESVLGTGFTYIDLSGYRLEANYSGRKAEALRPARGDRRNEKPDEALEDARLADPDAAETAVGAESGRLNPLDSASADPAALARITMRPIFESEYRRLVMISDQNEQFRPFRIDYYNRDRILFKAEHYYYDIKVLNKATRTIELLDMPGRREILHLERGSISRLEFYTRDPRVQPADALFDPDFLNR